MNICKNCDRPINSNNKELCEYCEFELEYNSKKDDYEKDYLLVQMKKKIFWFIMLVAGSFISFCVFGYLKINNLSSNPNLKDDNTHWVVGISFLMCIAFSIKLYREVKYFKAYKEYTENNK